MQFGRNCNCTLLLQKFNLTYFVFLMLHVSNGYLELKNRMHVTLWSVWASVNIILDLNRSWVRSVLLALVNTFAG